MPLRSHRNRVLASALLASAVGCGDAGAPRARMVQVSATAFRLGSDGAASVEQASTMEATGTERIELWAESFEQHLERSGTPGAAVALLVNGKRAFARGFGVKSADSREPVTPRTHFRIASLSKPLLALGALRLVEQGKLELDAAIGAYVPYFQRASGRQDRVVTLSQLLSHTAGVPDSSVARCSSPDQTIPEFFREPRHARLWSPPGWFQNYSNNGYALAAGVIAGASGVPFQVAMRELVFAPLGMPTTNYDGASQLDHATGHDDGGQPMAFPPATCEPSQAAGGVYTSVLEFSQVLQMLLESGRGFISASSFERMTTPAVDEARRTQGIAADSGMSYGLGFQIASRRGTRSITHTGLAVGYSSYFEVIPEYGLAAVAFANSEQAPVHFWPGVMDGLIDAAMAVTEKATGTAPPLPPPLPSWDIYVGHYSDPHGWLAELSIVREEAHYVLELDGGQAYPLSLLDVLSGELRQGPDGLTYIVTRLGVARRKSW